jgi:hypothetical protein
MELNVLKESVRRNLIKNDMGVLHIMAVGQNLIRVYESQNWERIPKKMNEFIHAYNYLITEYNKKETPIEDEIIELEERIEWLKNGNS